MTPELGAALAGLPPLWVTDGQETEGIVLPLRLSTRWHRITWFPIERDDDVLFGLTLTTVPEWRHFHISELQRSYAGLPVTVDKAHVPQRTPRVPDVAMYRFDDITPFVPSRPVIWK